MTTINHSQPREPTKAELDEYFQQSTIHENHITDSWHEQNNIEQIIFDIRHQKEPNQILLQRERHIRYLERHLHVLPRGTQWTESLQGWVAYWILHSLDLLNAQIPQEDASLLVAHLAQLKDTEQGGYGGGPGQSAHLASTYSTVMALLALGTEEALESIDVSAVGRFITNMKVESGAFRMSQGGEVDVRAPYLALSVASILGLLEGECGNELKSGCVTWLKSLQGFDGGIGGERGGESHGGNTYCGLAMAAILGQETELDLEAILDWAVMRQMKYEGGFQGRTNKLVDSCYSYWVGSVFAILGVDCFDAESLARYVLECCQMPNGGFRDKPGVARDFMHTCYSLSGLSVAKYYGRAQFPDCSLKRVNALFGLSEEKYNNALRFFRVLVK